MRRFFEDLVLLARLDRGHELESAPVDLVPLVKGAIDECLAIEPDRPVSYHGPRTAMVEGDEYRLTQVISNLLDNARAHTPRGTPVRITITREASHVVIDVADSGPGFEEEQIARVFDKFQRGSRASVRRSGGAGLGLSIVSAIVSAHGGTSHATNRPGRGARVSITLPSGRDSEG